MTKNNGIDDKSEKATSANNPDVIEKAYLIRVKCLTYPDGRKSCNITDIDVDKPGNDTPTPTTAEPNIEAPPKVPTQAVTEQSTTEDVAQAGANPKENKKDCELCEIVEDMLKEKARAEAAAKAAAAAPRRLPFWARKFVPKDGSTIKT
jgi:hypothetical protein